MLIEKLTQEARVTATNLVDGIPQYECFCKKITISEFVLCTRWSNKISMKKTLIGLCAIALAATVNAAERYSPPEGFTSICTLEENCAVEGSTLVSFGAAGDYVYKTLQGEFLCTPATFGVAAHPPRPGVTCAIIDPNASASSQASSTTQAQDTSYVVENGDYALISRSSGKALTIAKASETDGAKAVQQNFEQKENQIWQLQRLENGYYSLTAKHSEKSLENLEWDSKDGSDVQQLPWINSWNQHWAIQAVDEGYVKIVSRTNGQALDVYEMNTKNLGEVVLWTYWGGENQQWKLVPVDTVPASTADSSK